MSDSFRCDAIASPSFASLFLDAIASPSTYPCQSVGESVSGTGIYCECLRPGVCDVCIYVCLCMCICACM